MKTKQEMIKAIYEKIADKSLTFGCIVEIEKQSEECIKYIYNLIK